jgi:flavodoxin I
MKEKRAKVILIYGSTTGNTETLAEGVVSGLKRGATEVTVKDVTEAEVDKDDFVDFYNKMDKVLLTGKKAAVFGPGDKESYPDTYCGEVNILDRDLRNTERRLLLKVLRLMGILNR